MTGWEVLFYIWAMVRKRQHQAEQQATPGNAFTWLNPPLYPVNHPAYFIKDPEEEFTWSTSTFEQVTANQLLNLSTASGTPEANQAFVANFINCLDAAGILPGDDDHLWRVYSKWRSTGVGKNINAKAAWVVATLRQRWSQIAPMITAKMMAPVWPPVETMLAVKLVIGESDELITYLNSAGHELPPFNAKNPPISTPALLPSASPTRVLDTLMQEEAQNNVAAAAAGNPTKADDDLIAGKLLHKRESSTDLSKASAAKVSRIHAPITQSLANIDQKMAGMADDITTPIDNSDEDEEANDTLLSVPFSKPAGTDMVVESDLPSGDHIRLFAHSEKQLNISPHLIVAQVKSKASQPQNTGLFTIYSSLFAPLATPVLDNEGILGPGAPNDSLDDFISVLQNACLMLEENFGANTSTVSIAANDEWMQKMSAITGFAQFTLTGKIQNAQIFVQDVIGGISGLGGLRFSLSSAGSSIFPSFTTPGFLPSYNMMVLGVQPVSTKIKIVDILSFFDLPTWSDILSLDEAAEAAVDRSATSRSALYMQPNDYSTTWLRLSFILNDVAMIQDMLTCIGVTASAVAAQPTIVSNIRLIGRKRFDCARSGQSLRTDTASQVIFQADFDLSLAGWSTVKPFTAYFVVGPDTTRLSIRFLQGQDLDDMLDWLLDRFNSQNVASNPTHATKDSVHPSSILPSGAMSSGAVSIKLQDVAVLLKNPTPGSGLKFQNVSITLELDIYSACFFVTTTLPNFSLIAQLWEYADPDADTKRLPYVEDFDHFTPFSDSVTG